MGIYCLRDLDLKDAQSLSAMVRDLGDADVTVRVAAVTSLKTRGDAGAAERHLLLRLFLDDDDLRVRNAAAITLAHWGAPSAGFIEALRAATVGDNAQLKKAALTALTILDKK
jgi:HEAT repeat protein